MRFAKTFCFSNNCVPWLCVYAQQPKMYLYLALLLGAAQAFHAPASFHAGSFDADFKGITFDANDAAAMTKVMMPEKGLSGMGAVCLDGTDAGFYFAPAANKSNANDWQIYFEGGGWCYDEEDCTATLTLLDRILAGFPALCRRATFRHILLGHTAWSK